MVQLQKGGSGAIDLALDRARSGNGGVVLITGGPGVGKSRLLEAALTQALEGGFEVLQGGGDPSMRPRPYGPVLDALRVDRRSSIARRARSQGRRRDDERHDDPANAAEVATVDPALLDDLLRLLETATAAGPVVLALDSLHWADTPTLQAFAHLAQAAPRLRVLILAAFRPRPWSEDFARMMSGPIGGTATMVELRGLDADGTAELAGSILGAQPGPRLAGHLADTGGNPLLIAELIGALQAEGAIERRDGMAEVRLSAPPRTLMRTARLRLGHLSDRALGVLRLASYLGSSFSPEDIAAAAEQPITHLVSELTEAVDAGVLVDMREHLVFSSEMIRTALYEDQPAAVRRAVHSRIGQRLAAVGAPAERVAVHLALGATKGDAEVIDWLRRAADETLERMPMLAQEFLDHALDLAGPSYPGLLELQLERAMALVAAGRAVEAERAGRALLARAEGSGTERPARRVLARALSLLGRWVEAAEQWGTIGVDQRLAAPARARALGEGAMALVMTTAFDRAQGIADAATAGAAGVGAAACLGPLALAIRAARRGQAAAAAEMSAEVTRMAEMLDPEPGVSALAHLWAGAHLTGADRFDEAETLLMAGRRLGASPASSIQTADFDAALGILHLLTGAWDVAVRELTSAVEMRGFTSVLPARLHLAYVAVHRGDLPAAHDQLRAAAHENGADASELEACFAAFVYALVHEAEGDTVAARLDLEAAWDLAGTLGLLSHRVLLAPDLVRLTLASGKSKRAAAIADLGAEAALAMGTDSGAAIALYCRGLAALDVGLLMSSVERLRSSDRVLLRAQVCESASLAFSRTGHHRDALVLLEEARQGYLQLGAEHDLARLSATARNRGLQGGGSRGAADSTGWKSLSKTEARVVQLVTEGLTNRQVGKRMFISDRTVETHLGHVFKKLHVFSRVELAAAAATRSRPGGDGP